MKIARCSFVQTFSERDVMTTPTIIQNSALYFGQRRAPKTETALFRKLWDLDKDKRARFRQLKSGHNFIMASVENSPTNAAHS
jgi:hypothetical protein